MTKNVNQHSKIKHMEIRYHFLRDHYEKGDIDIDYVSTDFQLAYIFTKSLDYARFFLFVASWMFVFWIHENKFLPMFTLFDVWQKGGEKV